MTKSESFPLALRITSETGILKPTTVFSCSRMRFAILFLIFQATAAFVPSVQKTKTTTKLDLNRRDVVITGIMGLIGAPGLAKASSGSTFFYDDKIEQVKEASQQATEGGRLDLNSAFVVRTLLLPIRCRRSSIVKCMESEPHYCLSFANYFFDTG